ncbi:Pcl5p TDEL_0E02800 [Torulaspora delbrueckii]|uniref:Cyclin N-terminal domain-containing protein n=1 Tax=Torulaspora delbrueckii TaxID=4950 RepID=G8ZV79_TORDE|nr:hypothetical protein TDEL_0E02800 [Torulaspora delbrueckii]CCE92523.1 hypothetical protein TDEL_0E02800 [Torulaspora delbrueckii]
MVATNDLDRRLAYQTPPYEPRRKLSCPPTPISSSSEQLIVRITRVLCQRTEKISTDKIRNDVKNVNEFLKEVLRRSKSNRKTALVALAYFNKIYDGQLWNGKLPDFARCSKRIFLSCLILAHKYLNDNSFTMKTWNMISGLSQNDLCLMERWGLEKLDYRLLVAEEDLTKLEDSLATKKRTFDEEVLGGEMRQKKARKL